MKPIRVSIGMNLRGEAWGGGNQFGQALTAYLRGQGIDVVHDLSDPEIDLILLTDPRIDLQITAYNHHDILSYLRQVNPRALVVHRINECDERKGVQNEVNPLLRAANPVADHTVFVSGWLRDLHLGQGMRPRQNSVILNGSDSQIYTSDGYTRWDGREPLRLVTHHWSGHPMKGFDIYARLDALLPRYEGRLAFSYIGNLPPDFHFRHSEYFPPAQGEELAHLLRAHHAYITASQFEPGSNHQNDAALCGLPLLYRVSGSLPEYCAGFGLPFTEADFEATLNAFMESGYAVSVEKMPDYPHTATRTCAAYLELFSTLLDERETLLAKREWPQSIPVLHTSREALGWLNTLPPRLTAYLEGLHQGGGRYLPASEGLTEAGQDIDLPFRCYGVKLGYMLGTWDALSAEEQQTRIQAIQGFQVQGNPLWLQWARDAFLDPTIVSYVRTQIRRRERYLQRLRPAHNMHYLQQVISAETKQALATLAQVGAHGIHPYQDFPTRPDVLRRYLQHLDWAHPWEAGAHLATIAVYCQTEAPRFLPAEQVEALKAVCAAFIQHITDRDTGAYFLPSEGGETPAYDELINGAMKVLTALDWLDIPVHYPERLIDTTLSQHPHAEGCHLVDAVYVLYRCMAQTDYRRAEVQTYALHLVEMLKAHFNPLDGGFSYNVGRSQSNLYRTRITYQRPVSDIHGTILLTWAAAMLAHLLGDGTGWRVIKP